MAWSEHTAPRCSYLAWRGVAHRRIDQVAEVPVTRNRIVDNYAVKKAKKGKKRGAVRGARIGGAGRDRRTRTEGFVGVGDSNGRRSVSRLFARTLGSYVNVETGSRNPVFHSTYESNQRAAARLLHRPLFRSYNTLSSCPLSLSLSQCTSSPLLYSCICVRLSRVAACSF